MPLFQPSVLKKYLSQQDTVTVQKAYKKYSKYFHNATIQENIRNSKEEQFQEGFLRELFVEILGYTLNPTPKFNLTTELKNIKGSKKVDGAILKDDNALAVIELKGTNTKDLESIRQQAFDYKANQTGCIYVITSNFEKLRFYINNAVDYEEFNLFTLTEKDFELFYLCLAKDNLLANKPLTIKEASIVEEENITKKFYGDYSLFKRELYRDLVKQNRNNPILMELSEKTSKLTLFKISQKLIDRFLFILFAEDRGLLAPNSISTILKEWKALEELDMVVPLYDRYKQYFGYLDTGRKGSDKKEEIFAYNGGLFQPDTILDAVIIDDDLLYRHTKKLSTYDFESQVDVNILGHIFEHSLNEIESVNAEIEGTDFDKQKTKRKKDGVFYTPKYITKYIVENTIGKLCTEKKQELNIIDEEYAKGRKNRQATTIIKLEQQLKDYREWLLQLTICDPACGSGAFLNQALDFLIKEHGYIDELNKQLFGGGFAFPDIENQILEHNIYGVDLNEESIEIAKLSLWLRTAQPKRKLTSLNNNIKCGNSIIENKTIAGDKAFNWAAEFPEVFVKGGFDVIIGNPPYGAYLDQSSKDYFQKKFKTFQGNFEIYFFFIELIGLILKPNGKIGYITPDTWINIPQAKKLREYTLENYGINTIMIFNHSVFSEASVNAIVFILTHKQLNEVCEIITFPSKVYDIEVNRDNIKTAQIENWRNSDDKQFQVLQNNVDITIINKIKAKSHQGENYLDVCQGIVPYSTEHLSKEEVKNRIYHSQIKENDNYGIWIQGRAVNRYSINISEKEYLNYGAWLHRSRKPKYFSNDRILIQEITGGNPPRISAVNYDAILYHDPGIISCLNISNLDTKYLLVVINSKLISWYNVMTSPKGNRVTFPKILIGDIRKIPVIEVKDEKQQPFIKGADKMLTLNTDLQIINKKFTNYFSSQCKLEKLTKKLENWYELTFADFLKELNKGIKTSGGIQLTKKDEIEWMELFEDYKKQAQTLKQEIDKTDKEIDKMVYELYGLNEDEIGIVENS